MGNKNIELKDVLVWVAVGAILFVLLMYASGKLKIPFYANGIMSSHFVPYTITDYGDECKQISFVWGESNSLPVNGQDYVVQLTNDGMTHDTDVGGYAGYKIVSGSCTTNVAGASGRMVSTEVESNLGVFVYGYNGVHPTSFSATCSFVAHPTDASSTCFALVTTTTETVPETTTTTIIGTTTTQTNSTTTTSVGVTTTTTLKPIEKKDNKIWYGIGGLVLLNIVIWFVLAPKGKRR